MGKTGGGGGGVRVVKLGDLVFGKFEMIARHGVKVDLLLSLGQVGDKIEIPLYSAKG